VDVGQIPQMSNGKTQPIISAVPWAEETFFSKSYVLVSPVIEKADSALVRC
jgi:hypothetical protein